MSEPTLAEMSGEKQKAPQLPLNEITINGQTGEFRFRDVLAGLKEFEGGKKRYEEYTLGKEIDVIFLKIRRKLMAHQKDARPLATNEHNAKTDFVSLFGLENEIIKDTAENLREQITQLKTIQVVYAIYKGELVRVFVKGSSLGSETKDANVHDFYSYISSFKKNGRDDHFYECYTKLYSIQESGKLGPYYCMTYKEGEKLNDDEMKLVEEKMKIAFDFSNQVDDHFGDKEKEKKEPEKNDTKINLSDGQPKTTEDDYPEEEINPEDIPF